MTKDAIWQAFLDKNPDVAGGTDKDKVRMDVGSLRRFVYFAYDNGRDDALRFKGDHQSRAVDDLMGMFGMRK